MESLKDCFGDFEWEGEGANRGSWTASMWFVASLKMRYKLKLLKSLKTFFVNLNGGENGLLCKASK